MKIALLMAMCLSTALVAPLAAQKRPANAARPKTTVAKSPEIGQIAIVVDENLSVLRKTPSLFSESVHRMSRGRRVQIQGVQEADGVKFYKVTVPPTNFGWVQADAVIGKFRSGDEARLASLVQAYEGFERIETATYFFEIYPESKLKPPLLLLFGDTAEEMALQLSRQAVSRLTRKEMAASGAPLHSFFLNFNMLDRYRKLGVIYLVNPATRLFHYDGASWKEVIAKYATSPEAIEAQKRLDSLKQKMDKK
jgi:hypothetical protein